MSPFIESQTVFKYKSYHNLLECQCPNLAICKAENKTSYRIVHKDLGNNNNYLPPILIAPRTFKTCTETCSGYALSFFISVDKAESHFKRVISFAPKFAERVGSCIAACDLSANDGLVSTPDGKGHFDLHEYVDTDLKNRFLMIKEITT